MDIGIVDNKGNLLDMGSPFDFFGEASHTGNEAELVWKGLITPQAMQNRALLRRLLTAQGLTQHPQEWWHFHKYSMEELRAKYRLLDF